MAHRGNLFVISGPSGVGKGTLVARVIECLDHVWVSVSATTRKPRDGEIDGVHYRFMSNEEFDALVEQDGFLEWAGVHSKRYGTPRAPIEAHLNEGDTVILEIDVQGAFQVKEKMPEAHLVFIDAPSVEVIEKRLRGRGTESDDVIAARMRTALVELSQKEKYDYVLVNDDLDRAVETLVSYIEQQA